MTISVSEILDRGIHDKERVVLKVTSDDDAGHYVLMVPRVVDGRMKGGKTEATYWLHDKKVKAGDKIIVYTKPGKISSKELGEGNFSYFYYWAMPSSMFGGVTDRVVLGRLGTWNSFPDISLGDDSTLEPGSK